MDVMQKALYGGILPGGIALLLALIALVAARRGLTGPRLPAWAAPVAAAAGLLISFYAQFEANTGRWRWIIPAAALTALAWAGTLMAWPDGRPRILLRSLAVATGLALLCGALMWPSFYDRQPQWMRLVPFAAAAVLGLCLYPAAVRWATPIEALAVAIAGALLVPVVVFSGNAMFAELLVTAVVAAGAPAALALLVPGDRYRDWRRGVSAGALGLALAYPMFALLAWGNSFDLPASHAWALLLPCTAPLLIWVARIPGLSRRPLIAAIVAAACVLHVAVAGFALAFKEADTAAYDPGF
jgi:hypothetical protein